MFGVIPGVSCVDSLMAYVFGVIPGVLCVDSLVM